MATLSPNLSITLSQRRWACVLDPSLFLSHYGVLLVQSLGNVLELWVARELWHILDNPSFYLTQPEWVIPQTELELSPELQTVAQQRRAQALRRWELLRVQTPLVDLNLFWIGDLPADSFLPDGSDPQLIAHWEAIAQSLDQRLRQQSRNSPIITLAFRDTAALAAVLGSAFILTYQASGTSEKANTPPEICQMLERWGIPCQQIDALDAIAVVERENLLQLMISTGLSKFLWSGLNLIVLHLFVPSAFTTGCHTQLSRATPSWDEGEILEAGLLDCWEGAKGFWYRL
jgi:hypothetical protein